MAFSFRNSSLSLKYFLLPVIVTGLIHISASAPLCQEKISLKNNIDRRIHVDNPVNLKKLPFGKSFQVTHPHFTLLFYFSGQNIHGVILERKKDYPIHMRWCFFRSCVESPYDFKVIITDQFTPPGQNFFSISFPPSLHYKFEGLDFTSSR